MKRAFARRVSGVRSKIRWKMNRYKPSYDDIALGFQAFPDSTGLFSVGTKRRRTKQKQWNVETHRLSAKFHDWNGIRNYVCALFKSTPSVSSCCFVLRHNWLVILLSFLVYLFSEMCSQQSTFYTDRNGKGRKEWGCWKIFQDIWVFFSFSMSLLLQRGIISFEAMRQIFNFHLGKLSIFLKWLQYWGYKICIRPAKRISEFLKAIKGLTNMGRTQRRFQGAEHFTCDC